MENLYSIGCGRSDGRRHFDHKKEADKSIGPCLGDRMGAIGEDDIVFIRQLDLPTFIGLVRMKGGMLPAKWILHALNDICLRGEDIIEDEHTNKFYIPRLYMVGMKKLVANLPEATDESQDVTSLLEKALQMTPKQLIYVGQ